MPVLSATIAVRSYRPDYILGAAKEPVGGHEEARIAAERRPSVGRHSAHRLELHRRRPVAVVHGRCRGRQRTGVDDGQARTEDAENELGRVGVSSAIAHLDGKYEFPARRRLGGQATVGAQKQPVRPVESRPRQRRRPHRDQQEVVEPVGETGRQIAADDLHATVENQELEVLGGKTHRAGRAHGKGEQAGLNGASRQLAELIHGQPRRHCSAKDHEAIVVGHSRRGHARRIELIGHAVGQTVGEDLIRLRKGQRCPCRTNGHQECRQADLHHAHSYPMARSLGALSARTLSSAVRTRCGETAGLPALLALLIERPAPRTDQKQGQKGSCVQQREFLLD